jgi:hypothetical protein
MFFYNIHGFQNENNKPDALLRETQQVAATVFQKRV